jgi:hypothetical protein
VPTDLEDLDARLVGTWRVDSPFRPLLDKYGHGYRGLARAFKDGWKPPQVWNTVCDTSKEAVYELGENHRYRRSETPLAPIQKIIAKTLIGKIGGEWRVECTGGVTCIALEVDDIDLPVLPVAAKYASPILVKPAKAIAEAIRSRDKYAAAICWERYVVLEFSNDRIRTRYAGYEETALWRRAQLVV